MLDAESLLRDLIKKIAREQNFSNYELIIKPINSGGANYTSTLFFATLKCPNKYVELFAKVASIGEKLREIMDAKKLYKLEMLFYTKLSKVYESLELKENVGAEYRFVIPKFYGCNTNLYEETVVLQNLVAEGYENYDRFISLDWEHAASSIENLAKFHALSFAYQRDNPQEFEEVCKDLIFVEMPHDSSMVEIGEKQIARVLEGVKEEYRPRISKLLDELGEDIMWKFKKPLGTKVIVHGDFRPSNLMYKLKDNKVQPILVDYQTMHVGSPAADFIYFELCGTDSDFRAEHHERLMDHYYAELSAAMQRLGVDPTEAYPREVFDSEWQEMLPMYLILGIFVLPFVLVEADQAPKIDGDGGLETFAVQSNDLFTDRFSGIVEDCARWGLI